MHVTSRNRILFALLTGLLGGFAPAACSSDTGVETKPGLGPCTGPSCQTCTTDIECPAGSYCKSGACGQDCAPGSDTCGAGMTCSGGRCTPASSSGGAGGGGSGGSAGGIVGPPINVTDAGMDVEMMDADACAKTSVELSSETPNVLLLVDRSGSMADELSGGVSRWAAVREALVNPSMGLVPTLQAEVNLGLALYTGPDRGRVGDMDTVGTDDPDYVETEECPYLVQVPIAPSNAVPIEMAYRPVMMSTNANGQTPTGESIEAAAPALLALDPMLYPGRKVIVLATDGEPDLCADGNDEVGGRQRSVDAVTAAYTMGITTFVISVGSQVGEAHLHEIANLGQGLPADDPMDRFYRAADATQLAQAFDDIVNGVRSCTFTLDGKVTTDGSEGSVTIDGNPLVQDDPDGWRLNSPTEVEFLGAACDQIKTGDHLVNVSFPCDVIIPVPK